MSARIRMTHYRRGTVLWHGTSHHEGIAGLRGPMWVSDSHEVARWFATWRIGSTWDGTLPVRAKREVPRVMKLVVDVPFSLPTFDPRHMRDKGIEFHQWLQRITKREIDDRGEEEVCAAGFAGWRVVLNYETGDDIMICEPEKYLRRVPARGSWRP